MKIKIQVKNQDPVPSIVYTKKASRAIYALLPILPARAMHHGQANANQFTPVLTPST
jgi:hypothetical protein